MLDESKDGLVPALAGLGGLMVICILLLVKGVRDAIEEAGVLPEQGEEDEDARIALYEAQSITERTGLW